MTILFRYILREYVKVFTMCFAGLMTIYLVIDFFEKVRKFIRYDVEVSTVLGYFLLNDVDVGVQEAARDALIALGTEDARFSLVDLLTSGKSRDHRHAELRNQPVPDLRTFPLLLARGCYRALQSQRRDHSAVRCPG